MGAIINRTDLIPDYNLWDKRSLQMSKYEEMSKELLAVTLIVSGLDPIYSRVHWPFGGDFIKKMHFKKHQTEYILGIDNYSINMNVYTKTHFR